MLGTRAPGRDTAGTTRQTKTWTVESGKARQTATRSDLRSAYCQKRERGAGEGWATERDPETILRTHRRRWDPATASILKIIIPWQISHWITIPPPISNKIPQSLHVFFIPTCISVSDDTNLCLASRILSYLGNTGPQKANAYPCPGAYSKCTSKMLCTGRDEILNRPLRFYI